jgi:hypothetical protein
MNNIQKSAHHPELQKDISPNKRQVCCKITTQIYCKASSLSAVARSIAVHAPDKLFLRRRRYP